MSILGITRKPGQTVEIGENALLTVDSIQKDVNGFVGIIVSFSLDIDDARETFSLRIGEIFSKEIGDYTLGVFLKDVRGNHVKVGLYAPKCVNIFRSEMLEALRRTYQAAAKAPSKAVVS